MLVNLLRYRLPSLPVIRRILLLTLSLMISTGNSVAGQVTLAWDAVASATGYKVHYGQDSSSYSSSVDAKSVTSYTVPGLTDGARYYFAVTAYGAAGTTESGYSNRGHHRHLRIVGTRCARREFHRKPDHRHGAADGHLHRYLNRKRHQPIVEPGGRHDGHNPDGGQDLFDAWDVLCLADGHR